jgi:hypothetical protein
MTDETAAPGCLSDSVQTALHAGHNGKMVRWKTERETRRPGRLLRRMETAFSSGCRSRNGFPDSEKGGDHIEHKTRWRGHARPFTGKHGSVAVVDDLLDLSRISRGKINLQLERWTWRPS